MDTTPKKTAAVGIMAIAAIGITDVDTVATVTAFGIRWQHLVPELS